MAAVDSFGLLVRPLEIRLRNIRDALELIGFAYSAYITAKVAWRLFCLLKQGTSRFIVGLSRPCYVTKYGKWVVIAGGINGLGIAFASQYASAGMNVLLLSRDEVKLRKVQDWLRKQYNVEVEILPCNFLEQQQTTELYDAIEEKLDGKDIGILINNVSYMPADPTYFSHYTRDQLNESISANIVSITMLTHLVLPGMIARRRGEVINIGSFMCTHPSPLVAMFCASKRFVEYLSHTLNEEVCGTNVRVRCLTPLCVARDVLPASSSSSSLQQAAATATTPASSGTPQPSIAQRTHGWLVPSADRYVQMAIPFIETTSGRSTTGYLPHEVLSWLFERMSARLWARFTFGVNKGFREIRQRRKSSAPARALHK